MSQFVHLLIIQMTQTASRYITINQGAYDEIKDIYDLDELHDIARNGCAVGCASSHIYYSDTVDFYEKHEDEINEYICDALGVDTVFKLDNVAEFDGILNVQNLLCWMYIELVASEILMESGHPDYV